VSFAPYRGHQDPVAQDIPSPEQVESDLKALVGHVGAVRTYGSTRGLEVVPRLARPLGIKVTMGAWLTSEATPIGRQQNEAEIAGLINLANAYPDTITRVIVGNEVLLRNDLPPGRLIDYIGQVKAAVRQPVSYADVWVFFLKHPDVGRALDLLTIHVLPFWEDEPVAVDGAEEHMMRSVDEVRAAFPGKPILIGETGWPSMGRDRGAAAVSTVNEARYDRMVPAIAARHDLDYNIVEAFDQPWKASLENTVGANWGILDADRAPKFAMRGPVVEVGDWPVRAAVAILAGIAATLLLGGLLTGLGGLFVFALVCQGLAWLATTSGFHISAVSYTWSAEAWAIVRAGVPAVFACAIAARAAQMIDGEVPRSSDWWRGAWIQLGFAVYAMIWTLLLLVDGRYRDIPEIDFLVPCFGTWALIVVRATSGRVKPGFVRALSVDGLFSRALPFPRGLMAALAIGLILAALLSPVSESVALAQGEDFARDHPSWAERWPLLRHAAGANREMVFWAIMQALMAVPFAVAGLGGGRSRI
jgi:exo-beta-1,3-glucanase (GH17 family)